MRTPQELLDKADEILLRTEQSTYSTEGRYWMGAYAAAYVSLAMGITAIGAIERADGSDYVGPA